MTQTGSRTEQGWCAGAATRVLFSALLLTVALSAHAAEESKPAPAVQKEEPKPESIKKDIQGPATIAPREIYEMLEQRKRLLDKRETAVRGSETHLLELKAELEQIVTRHEQAVEAEKKRRQAAQAKGAGEADKAKTPGKATPAVNVNQAQLAKIYEAMPAEEAAARLERMPERKALEVLRLLKGKSAGAILAEVKPERAARLTEQLLTTP
ncbi:MAG: MgtEN domain-containing protein [Nitrospira sp.]|nr:MAG: MgtEN domain-containing protein [Nitrospira sp.]